MKLQFLISLPFKWYSPNLVEMTTISSSENYHIFHQIKNIKLADPKEMDIPQTLDI